MRWYCAVFNNKNSSQALYIVSLNYRIFNQFNNQTPQLNKRIPHSIYGVRERVSGISLTAGSKMNNIHRYILGLDGPINRLGAMQKTVPCSRSFLMLPSRLRQSDVILLDNIKAYHDEIHFCFYNISFILIESTNIQPRNIFIHLSYHIYLSPTKTPWSHKIIFSFEKLGWL